MKKHIIIALSFLALVAQAFAQQSAQPDNVAAKNEKYLAIKFGLFKKYYEGGEKISKYAFEEKIKTNPLGYKQYRSGKNMMITSNIIGIPSGFIFGYQLGYILFDRRSTTYYSRRGPNNIVLLVSGFAWGTAVGLEYAGKTKIIKSIRTYNQSVNPGIGYRLGITPNGFGLGLQF